MHGTVDGATTEEKQYNPIKKHDKENNQNRKSNFLLFIHFFTVAYT